MSAEHSTSLNSAPVIELTGVFKYFQGEWPALTDINLTVYQGDFLFLLGATGAGKTTMLRLLYRHELPDAGSIKVLGYELALMKEKDIPNLRRRLGVIFQDFKLLSDRTVHENLEFVLRAINTQPDMIPAKIQETLAQLGLVHKKNSYPHELSGGEQQKVSIARALVKSPDIVLADEPTGNIDPKASDDILNILKDINYQGTTVIMATHDAEIAERTRRRRVTLDAGRIVRDEG